MKRKETESSKSADADQAGQSSKAEKPKRLKTTAQREAARETLTLGSPARKSTEVDCSAIKTSSRRKPAEGAAEVTVGSPTPAGVMTLASPDMPPRRFPEDAEVVLTEATSVAASVSAMASGLSHFVEEGVRTCARLKKVATRAKAGEEAVVKDAAAAREASRDADVRRAAAEGEAKVSKAEKASLEEEMARQAAEVMATQPALVKAIADRIFRSEHFSGFVADAASLMNQATVSSVLDEVAADYPNLDKTKYGYAEVVEEEIMLDYARLIAHKAPGLPIIGALASSPIVLKPEVVSNCRVDRDKKLELLLTQVAKEDEEAPQPQVQDETLNSGEQPETEVAATNEAGEQGRVADQPHDEEAQGAVS